MHTEEWAGIGKSIYALAEDDFKAQWMLLSDEDKRFIPQPWLSRCSHRFAVIAKPNGRNGHDIIPPAVEDLEIVPDERRTIPQPLDWSALEGTEPPDRQWATTFWFGMGHVTLMVGAGGIGKTLCAQQWGSALAIGAPFIDATPRPLKVLMWACEDDKDELHRRQLDIAAWLKQPLSAFKGLELVPRHGHENTLMSMEFGRPMFTSILKDLREQACDLGAEAVILDNAAQLYGGNENARHDVTAFMNRLSGELPGRAIMLLSHPSRAPGSEFSGSGAWEAVARTRLYLGRKLPDQPDEGEAREDDTTRYLARRKANYGPRDYRRFDYNNGVLVQDVTEGAGGIIGSIRKRKALEVVIDGLLRLAEKQIRTTDGKTSPQYLPRVLKDYELDDGLTIRDLGDAMRQAVMSGRIERGVIGRYENRTPMYGLRVTGHAPSSGAQT